MGQIVLNYFCDCSLTCTLYDVTIQILVQPQLKAELVVSLCPI